MDRSQPPMILIPARIGSSRLPGKPLADIGGKPMICRVLEVAQAADLGPVAVATDDATIAEVVRAAGGQAVMTDPNLPSGSDRIWQALCQLDPHETYCRVINLQGDLPELDPAALRVLDQVLLESGSDLATLVCPADASEASQPQLVKAVVSWAQPTQGQALYFSRAPVPHGSDHYWHHIGIYGWSRTALARFVALPPSPLEQTEKLEQLRALEAGMQIAVAPLDSAPPGIDTQADLDAARARVARTGDS
jgi:3-deoxy-manno-octulosonate cytidylyltransferase (CMP-KDO synthetase)